MKNLRCCWVGFVWVFSALLTFGAEEVADDLWRHMRDGGLITQEQYQYVLKEGRLPGGTIVKDSPVSEEEQSDWQQLAEHHVISSEELAALLFSGSVPNMSAAENKAFEELAPVYQPDRAKRLGYDLRRKHQKVDLIRLKHKETIRWNNEYAEAVEKAKTSDLPLRIENKDGQISELFAWRHGQPVYLTTHNRISADTISVDEIRPGGSEPFALTGSNVTVAVWDGGNAVSNHVEFPNGRVWWGNDISNTAVVASHATGVAGTIAAAGIDTNAQGMAYAAQVESYDWNYNLAEMAACIESNENIQISNHSYGMNCGWDMKVVVNGQWRVWRGDTRLSVDEDYRFGWYQEDSQALDEFCFSAPYHLPVYSAGNDRGDYNDSPYAPQNVYWNYPVGDWYLSSHDRPSDGLPEGYDCITPFGVSKNILTVGAVQDLPGGYTNGATVVLESYSGTGPTDDGRIKPDVVANGQQLHTTYGTNADSYADVSGTSFSAPSVSGSLALVQELHERIHGTDEPLLASSLKGIAIHTAHDIGLTGPDYTFGWGLFSAPVSAWSVTNNASWDSLPYIKEVALIDGDFIEFEVSASTNEPLKVTIVWADPEGSVQPWELDPTNRVLINDLDLRIIDSSGTTNFPWVLDLTNPSTAATTGDNVLDNVEQVVVTPPSNTVYTVSITHKGSLSNGMQDVSILLSGNIATHAPEFVIQENINNGVADLEWSGVVGGLYQIEASVDLVDTNGWLEKGTISAPSETLDWIDTDSTNHAIRFYRIKRER